MVRSALLHIVLLLGCSFAFASEESPQSFVLDGTLYSDSAQGSLLEDAGVFTIQILDSAQTCIVYEETQNFDTRNTKGAFNIQVGEKMTGTSKRTASDPGHSLASIFANTGAGISGKSLSNGSACTGANTDGLQRYIRVVVTPSSDHTPRAMSLFSMGSVSSSWVAETLQGKTPSAFLQVNTVAPASLSQANLENIFSTTNYPVLTSLLSNGANGYVPQASNGSVSLPSFASTPSTPAAGQIWYDSSGVLKFWNGSSAQTLGVSGSGITSLTVGAGLTPTGTITTTGSIAVDVGTSAGQIVQVQTGGKLPVLDGSNLTNVTASAFSATGSISTSGTLAANSGNFRSLTLTNAGAQSVTLQPAASITGSPLTFTWPSAYPGVAGYVLSSDTSGNMSWVAQSAGGLAAVSNTASLANGKVWVGDGSGKAQEVSVTGDVAITNTGSSTVNGIKGVSVTAAPTLTGQVLRYNGASLAPAFLSMFDLRSTVTGTQAFGGVGCLSNQTLTWTAATDNLACSNISLPVGQVTGTLPVANGGTGAVSLSANQLLLGNGTSAVSSLSAGSSGQMLQSTGASSPAWSTATYPSTTTANQLLYSSAANTVAGLTTANSSALVTNSSGVPSFTSGATANRLLRTNGTAVSFAQADLTTDVTGTLPIANGGTGSATQTWVDLTTAQTVAGVKTWSNNAIFNANVGVGTASPGNAVEVYRDAASSVVKTTSNGSAGFTPDAAFSAFGYRNGNAGGYSGFYSFMSGGTAGAYTPVATSSFTGGLIFRANYNTGASTSYQTIAAIEALTGTNFSSTDREGTLIFETSDGNASSAAAERMRIDNTGNVGIGTTTPGQKLTVAGTIESTSGGVKYPDGTTQTSANNVTVTNTTVSGATTLSFPSWGHSLQNLTMTTSATISIPAGAWIGQSVTTVVCQNGTGGFTPTFAGSGTTLHATYPAGFPTTTANKCDVCGWIYYSTNSWILTGCNVNE